MIDSQAVDREQANASGGDKCHVCGTLLPPENSGFAFCPVCDVEEPMHEKIFRVALEWCEKNTEWKRICDIPNSDALYKTWKELPAKVRKAWERQYGDYSAEDAWSEFGRGVCKVDYGFIGTDGVFYPQITDVPLNVNSCQVFRVGGGGAEHPWDNAAQQSAAATATTEDQSSGPRALGAVLPNEKLSDAGGGL